MNSKPKICPDCNREYEQEHRFCSLCGRSLVDNPSYLNEIAESNQQQAPIKKVYSTAQYESAKKEVTEKVNLLISKYSLYKDEYLIPSTIGQIEDTYQHVMTLFSQQVDLDEIILYCDWLKQFCERFNSKFRNVYYMDHLFDFDVSTLTEKRFEVKDTLKRLLYDISNVATYYRDNRKQLAIQNKPLLERDIASINQLYVALCTKVEAASSRERFIPFILEPDLVNELFRILEISNGAIHRYDKILCEIR